MIALGKYRDVTWPDNWTSTTIDGKKTAQFGMLCLGTPFEQLADSCAEHTLLVTETGVEILTARKADSPGGPIPMPATASETPNGSN
jgi:methionyl aminopeptidase